MEEYLKPHRDLEAERQLKTLIQEIESLMNDPGNNAAIENMLNEAARFVNAPDRILDLTVIEGYESWTDLDGLVGELTMKVLRLPAVTKESFVSIIQFIREVLKTEETPDHVPLDYFMNFYREFFLLHFPDIADELFDKIFEDASLEELMDMAFPQP